MNREKAEDACHDVFLNVPRNLASLDFNRNITGWLLTVARNHCYDIYRADSREFTIEFPPEVLADSSMKPEDNLGQYSDITRRRSRARFLSPYRLLRG